MRRDPLGGDGGDDDASVGNLFRIAAVAADDAIDISPDLFGQFERANEVNRDVFLTIAAAYGENEERVPASQP
jgi:hypothetical protein